MAEGIVGTSHDTLGIVRMEAIYTLGFEYQGRSCRSGMNLFVRITVSLRKDVSSSFSVCTVYIRIIPLRKGKG